MVLCADYRIAYNRPMSTPTIFTPGVGPTTESARLQAALNMKFVPDVKERVERHLIETMGQEAGMAESRRRYPEAY